MSGVKKSASSLDGRERKISLPNRNVQSRICARELRRNYKRLMSVPAEKDMLPIYDPMAKSESSKTKVRKNTGVCYDERFADYFCLWDSEYPENPQRYLSAIQRCQEYGLLDRCTRVDTRMASKNEVLTFHTEQHYTRLLSTRDGVVEQLKEMSKNYDSVYIHSKSFDCASLALGSVLNLLEEVLQERVQNGMAIIRPPGHHAMKEEFCGYCYFNNVAIAALTALESGLNRVLIVDWDVHHGQGTQRAFYDDPRVLYFSTHRYEHGRFWPNLRESDCDWVGGGSAAGKNINFPLNEIGLKNEDFLAIFHQVLLPVAYEFDPQLVLISAGFDTAIGDWKGEMLLTPALFAHLTSMLMTFANGKVVVVLEGGYCVESLAESVALTLRTLIGDPCPPLVDTLGQPRLSTIQTIREVVSFHQPYWKCFKRLDIPGCVKGVKREFDPQTDYVDDIGYPTQTELVKRAHGDLLLNIKRKTTLTVPDTRVCLVYDCSMEKHINLSDSSHPERPARTREIMKTLKEFGLVERVKLLKSREANISEIEAVHSNELTNLLERLPKMNQKSKDHLASEFNSIYFNEHSLHASLLAAGCFLEVLDEICSNNSLSGVAVVRPPGHHADVNCPMGFCIINNVAVGAAYACKKYGYERILILDWDIHHGNGTQEIFEDSPNVLYISIHLYEDGRFFPHLIEAASHYVGRKYGRGYNVNIPWSKSGVRDGDYMSALMTVVMPIAYAYNPQLVLVSAGFDAAVNDPLGGCNITPECFGHMTHHLSQLAGGRIALVLEGGYNLISISHSISMCVKALLGDPMPSLGQVSPSAKCVKTITEVVDVQRELWTVMECHPTACKQPVAMMVKSEKDDLQELEDITDNLGAMNLRSGDICTEDLEDIVGGYSGRRCEKDDTKFELVDEIIVTKSAAIDKTTEEDIIKCGEFDFLTDNLQKFSMDSDSGKISSTKDADGKPDDDDLVITFDSRNEKLNCPKEVIELDDSEEEGGKHIESNASDNQKNLESFKADITSVSVSNPTNLSNLKCGAETDFKDKNVSSMSSKISPHHGEDEFDKSGGFNLPKSSTSDKLIPNTEKGPALDSSLVSNMTESLCDSDFVTPPESPEKEAGLGIGLNDEAEEMNLEGAVGGVGAGATGEMDIQTAELIASLTWFGGTMDEFYAVQPLDFCPHLIEIKEVPKTGIDTTAPCVRCGDTSENWVCLICYEVYCSRYVNEHMVHHGKLTSHNMVLSFSDISVWCYVCQSYVDNLVLEDCKTAVRRNKFGNG